MHVPTKYRPVVSFVLSVTILDGEVYLTFYIYQPFGSLSHECILQLTYCTGPCLQTCQLSSGKVSETFLCAYVKCIVNFTVKPCLYLWLHHYCSLVQGGCLWSLCSVAAWLGDLCWLTLRVVASLHLLFAVSVYSKNSKYFVNVNQSSCCGWNGMLIRE